MVKRFIIQLILLCFIAMSSVAQTHSDIYIDKKGTIRWKDNNKKAYFFGVNYVAPFAFGYRQIEAKGINVEEAIRQDVYHFARMGINAFRIHVFDTEISDSLGNIKDNEHLRLFDYLIAELEKRNIKIILTPIAFWGNGYPEKDIPTGAFSYKYGKKGALINKKAWRAQENYLTQFFTRKNRYTGKTYQQDNAVIATEINNEPWHTGDKKTVTQYINKMISTVRKTGWTKPVFYNISESPEYAGAIIKSKAQGYTFQWYPSGLVAGRTQQGNFLPHVSKYNIPFDTIPGFEKGARMVYEFAAADISGSYIYPAMAKSFRNAGFQWATMFAYDPMALADVNTEYQTHYLNLAYTPSKAISFMIANEVFRYGAPAFVSYPQNRSQLLNDTLFYYSNSSDINIDNSNALKHIAGVGSSALINYEGNGAYFLDKLADGVWRLEVMPDVIPLSDPFATASPNKKVRAIAWNNNKMEISLPDLGEGFIIKGINKGNPTHAEAEGKGFHIYPGTYILQKKGEKPFALQPNSKTGNLFLNEFVAPKPDKAKNITVNHHAPRTLSTNSDFKITADVFGIHQEDSVMIMLAPLSGKWQKIPMQKSGVQYIASVPHNFLKPGLLRYYIIIHADSEDITFPGGFSGNPYDWDFYSKKAYKVFVNKPETGLILFDAQRDRNNMNYYIPNWKEEGYSFVATPESDKLGLKSFIKKPEKNGFTGWQIFIGDLVQDREKDLTHFNSIVIKAMGSKKGQEAKISLITKNGNSYSASFKLQDTLSNITIPLTDFKQTDMLLLPRPYPRFQPLFYHSGEEKPLHIKNIERIGLTLPYHADSKDTAVTVLQILLR